MSATYNGMRDVYTRVKEAYNDLGEADQISIRLRYAALFGCLIASLMCMRIPAYGFSVSRIMPCRLLCVSGSLPVALTTMYLVCYSYSARSWEIHSQSDYQYHIWYPLRWLYRLPRFLDFDLCGGDRELVVFVCGCLALRFYVSLSLVSTVSALIGII